MRQLNRLLRPIMNELEELKKYLIGKVAVYIDAANLEKSVQQIRAIPPGHIKKGQIWRAKENLLSIDYKKLYNLFQKNCKLSYIGFYTAKFNTVGHNKFLSVLKSIGFKLVTKDIKRIIDTDKLRRRCNKCNLINEIETKFKCSRCGHQNDFSLINKADVDVEISVNSTYNCTKFDTMILFSGDSDYKYLLDFLKKKGKKIVVLSRRGHVSDELRNLKLVDCYMDILKLKNYFLKRSNK